ncbi:unnamed protein product [Heligmosomoides polygyrus]|uniref:Reverse transcriptase domain-containing protein n=1 Tax=Heligmosomoides polygyrus TaxID=6339 RepID=A0A183GK32_HELPZ|nr:unnamed protein product [Heligmosomoides polygyrus]
MSHYIPYCSVVKKKGSFADCSNYRPIRLPSHSVKIFERFLDRRIREIVKLSDNQCGFASGTIDATHAVRLLVEKHREKQKSVHIASLDLKKAFDRLSLELIWYALRQYNVAEELIEWVRMLYSCPKSRVQAAAGTSMEFPISVGSPGFCAFPTPLCCRHGCHYAKSSTACSMNAALS